MVLEHFEILTLETAQRLSLAQEGNGLLLLIQSIFTFTIHIRFKESDHQRNFPPLMYQIFDLMNRIHALQSHFQMASLLVLQHEVS